MNLRGWRLNSATRRPSSWMPALRTGSTRIGYMACRNWMPGRGPALRQAKRVANPGCYPTGAITLLRPLVAARGWCRRIIPITVNAISGYSGGGPRHDRGARGRRVARRTNSTAWSMEHKHVPELQKYAQLTRRPIFVPAVGHFRQGMLVSIPLHLDTLPGKPSASDLTEALAAYYRHASFIRVLPTESNGKLEPEALNETTTQLELRVFANPTIWARGAGGAAGQSRQGGVWARRCRTCG